MGLVKKHIPRDFSQHRRDTFRPYEEFYKVEVISFEHSLTKVFFYTEKNIESVSNVATSTHNSIVVYMSSDKKNKFKVKCNYFAEMAGEYRIDIVYECSTEKDLKGKVFGKDMIFEGSVNHTKRKELFKDFELGNQTITLELPKNVYLYGVIVRKTKEYTGDSLDSFGTNLLLEKVDTTASSEIAAHEATFVIGYDNALENLLTSTGLYMDYNDEVNIYLKGAKAVDETQIFGGYLSSIQPDAKKTTLTISCADRMVDGQNKYILTEMRLLGGTTLPQEDTYKQTMKIDFDTYGQALKYLCNCLEISLKNNIGDNNLVTGETAKVGFNIEFGKKKTIRKVTTKNSTAAFSKNFVTIRNEPSAAKKQEIILYNGKDKRKTPVEITDYDNFVVVYGLGDAETSHDEKTTSKADGSSGFQKFNKCGVSADKQYIMAVGRASANGELGKYGYTFYKRVYERKCPACGSTELFWSIFWAGNETSNWGTFPCTGRGEGGSAEGHIFCKGCDADWSIFGKPHGGTPKHLKSVSSLVKATKDEAYKLKDGKVTANPKTLSAVSADSIFKTISNEAFSKFTYKLRGTTYSTASGLEKHGVGDCHAFSEWIFKKLKSYKVNCKVVQYKTSQSNQHRSVMYKNKKNEWVDFPYREYGWGSKYNNNLNNTSGSKHPDSTPFKYTAGGTIEQATGGTKSSTETTTVKVTEGYSRDKVIQGYFAVTLSIQKSFKAKTKTVFVGFTQKAASTYSLSGFSPVWINNTVKRVEVDLLKFVREAIYGDFDKANKYYLHSIKFIAPVNKVVDTDATNHSTTTQYKVEDWYTYDKSTHDNSSCKMDLYSINFNNGTKINPDGLQSCGKTVNTLFEELLKESNYTARRSYEKHRCDDRIDFSVDNQTAPAITVQEGDENNILEINGISYTPRTTLFNKSVVVFKDNTHYYKYVDTHDLTSILKYGEQTTLETSNEEIGSKEAYYNAMNSDKYNPTETFNFTVVLPYFVNVQVGDLVQVIANSRKLNTIKKVSSVKYSCSNKQIPKIQTELGLGELPIDLQIAKELREIRAMAKKETTSFDSTAEPVSDDIYVWDN